MQRLVKDYAKTKGYLIEGYHGTRFNFDAFDRTELGKNTGTGISKEWFFAADQETAESYSPYHVIKSLEKTSPKMYPEGSADKLKNKGNLYHLGMKIDNPLYVDLSEYDYAAHRENADALLEYSKLADGLGHDGIVFYNAMDNNLKTGVRESVLYLFKNGEQAKSLDPITRDKEGNIIPLSQRFDENINNMNYSLDVDTEGRKLSEGQAGYDSIIWIEGDTENDIAIMPFEENAIKRTDNLKMELLKQQICDQKSEIASLNLAASQAAQSAYIINSLKTTGTTTS